MLILIGLGLNGLKSLSIEAIEALKGSDKVYIEVYTSPVSISIDELKHLISNEKDKDIEVEVAKRWLIEDGKRILSEAKIKNVSILCYGDPLVATTHTELLARARSNGIDYKVIHNASAITSILGSCGLHVYKLGRIATLVRDKRASLSTYHALYTNLLLGYHTLLLLEYDHESNLSLSPNEAFNILLACERDEQLGIFSSDTFAIVASRLGMESEHIVAGKIGSMINYNFGEPPYAIVVTGSMHFTEIDALKSLKVTLLDEARDNTIAVRSKAEIMLSKYIPRAKDAVANALSIIEGYNNIEFRSRLKDIVYNAEYYISDAESYAKQHRYENAILALGYAEGLIDSIRYIVGRDPWEFNK
jgi:diphthine synthase